MDRTLLRLNEVIEPFGYVFEVVNLADFERLFSNLIFLPENFKSRGKINIQPENLTVSQEFLEMMQWHPIFMHCHSEVIMLKRSERLPIIASKPETIANIEQEVRQIHNFVNSLTQQLRLYKSGSIVSPMFFLIECSSRVIHHRSWKYTSIWGGKIYSLEEDDISALKGVLQKDFPKNPLTDLAISYFNLFYESNDSRTKYLTLMTVLETLLNLGKDQITHTVSRNVSLIISNNATEFQENYQRMKKLYGLRSTIVHGSHFKPDLLSSSREELELITRKVINYCQALTISKDDLFQKFNTAGYNQI